MRQSSKKKFSSLSPHRDARTLVRNTLPAVSISAIVSVAMSASQPISRHHHGRDCRGTRSKSCENGCHSQKKDVPLEADYLSPQQELRVTKSKESPPIGPSIVMDAASQIGPSYANLEPGDPAPWFHQRTLLTWRLAVTSCFAFLALREML
jgi:hypothetical protein